MAYHEDVLYVYVYDNMENDVFRSNYIKHSPPDTFGRNCAAENYEDLHAAAAHIWENKDTYTIAIGAGATLLYKFCKLKVEQNSDAKVMIKYKNGDHEFEMEVSGFSKEDFFDIYEHNLKKSNSTKLSEEEIENIKIEARKELGMDGE